MAIEIRTARASDTGAVRTLVTRGLADDPLFRLFFPVEAEPEQVRLARIAAYLAPQVEWLVGAGTAHVALDGDELVGAAVWREPDAERPGLLPASSDTWRLLVPEPRATDLACAMRAAAEGQEPADGPYLALLATDPTRTGQGIGSLLLDEAARRWPGPRWLESTNQRNHSFYLRHGYRLAHQGSLTGSDVVLTQLVAP